VLGWSRCSTLAPLWDELRRRMGASDRPVKSVQLVLDAASAPTLTSLFQRRAPYLAGQTLQVTVAKLCERLQVTYDELRQVVEASSGPIENRAHARLVAATARASLWATADARIGNLAPRTLERIRAGGVPSGDVDAHDEMLARLATALERLPMPEPLPVPVLAWSLDADPHSLDGASALGRWFGMAVVERAGGDPDRATPVDVREAARTSGLLYDRLSTPTLTWAVRASASGPTGHLLELAAEAGAPLHLSDALLDRDVTTFTQARWLCVENPSVVESIMLAGLRIPTVCTSGWPSSAAQRLLDLARRQGVELCYAGDFDPEGLKIAKFMHERFAATVLMTARGYEAAHHERARPWQGDVPETPWEPPLREAIQVARRLVYQEDPAVFASLMRAWPAD
jgi:uncharacterized protein (TIGR02679 family)